jgi:hypothetical protein
MISADSAGNHSKVGGMEAGSTLRNEPQGLSQLDRLGPPPGAELVEHPAGMGLDRVFADEGSGGDLLVA